MAHKLVVTSFSKAFCSDRCASMWRVSNVMKCECKPICDKEFNKQTGFSRFGKYFCSDECLNADEDVEQMILER